MCVASGGFLFILGIVGGGIVVVVRWVGPKLGSQYGIFLVGIRYSALVPYFFT